MEVKISVLESSSESYLELKQRLNSSMQELENISSAYRDITCINQKIGQINSVKSQVQAYACKSGSFSQALERIRTLYQEYENRVSDECDGVRRMSVNIPTGVQNVSDVAWKIGAAMGGTAAAGAAVAGAVGSGIHGVDLDEVIGSGAIDTLGDMKSMSGKIEGLLEYADYFSGGNAAELFDEIDGNGILKMAGYLDDYDDLKKAWESGDADDVKAVLEKYLKKAVGKLTDVPGVGGSLITDLGVNIGKNFVEGWNEYIEEPSFDTAWDFVWDSSVGALWDTGTGLTKDFFSVVYPIFGEKFDETDYDTAMNWLEGTISGVVKGTVENFVEGATKAGEFIAERVEEIGKGLATAGETIASWLPW